MSTPQNDPDGTIQPHVVCMKCRNLLILCVLTLPATAALGNDRPVLLRAILDAWQTRRSTVKSFAFSWKSTEFHSAGSEPFILAKGAPATDTSFDAKATYIVDGIGRFRVDYIGMAYNPTSQSYVAATTIDENDGSKRISFFPNGIQEFPNAQITADPDSESANTSQTLPIRLVYRTADPIFGVIDVANLTVVESSAVINETECIGVRQAPSSSSPLDVVIWVDPSKDYIPVQYWSRFQGRPVAHVAISSFVRDDVYGWVPEKWTIARKFEKSGSPCWSDSVVMTKFEINHRLPDDAFEIHFPVGTWVQNNITNEAYIVREKGEVRPVLAGEFDGTNYKEILNSEPAHLKPRTLRLYLIMGNVAVITVIVYLILRKRAAKIRVESPS